MPHLEARREVARLIEELVGVGASDMVGLLAARNKAAGHWGPTRGEGSSRARLFLR